MSRSQYIRGTCVVNSCWAHLHISYPHSMGTQPYYYYYYICTQSGGYDNMLLLCPIGTAALLGDQCKNYKPLPPTCSILEWNIISFFSSPKDQHVLVCEYMCMHTHTHTHTKRNAELNMKHCPVSVLNACCHDMLASSSGLTRSQNKQWVKKLVMVSTPKVVPTTLWHRSHKGTTEQGLYKLLNWYRHSCFWQQQLANSKQNWKIYSPHSQATVVFV